MTNLGLCFEKVQKTASAWASYGGALVLARRLGDNREGLAHDKQEALFPHLAKLRIVVAAPAADEVIERRGRGKSVPAPAQWGTAIPVDAGDHVVRAAAPGHAPFEAHVQVMDGSEVQSQIPSLTVVVAEAKSTTAVWAPPAPVSGGISAGRWTAVAMGAVGLISVGVGATFYVLAKSKLNDEGQYCNAMHQCSSGGVADNNDASTFANVADIGFIAGGALLAGAIVTWILAPGGSPDSRPTGVATAVSPLPGGGALTFAGRF